MKIRIVRRVTYMRLQTYMIIQQNNEKIKMFFVFL